MTKPFELEETLKKMTPEQPETRKFKRKILVEHGKEGVNFQTLFGRTDEYMMRAKIPREIFASALFPSARLVLEIAEDELGSLVSLEDALDALASSWGDTSLADVVRKKLFDLPKKK